MQILISLLEYKKTGTKESIFKKSKYVNFISNNNLLKKTMLGACWIFLFMNQLCLQNLGANTVFEILIHLQQVSYCSHSNHNKWWHFFFIRPGTAYGRSKKLCCFWWSVGFPDCCSHTKADRARTKNSANWLHD